jgi:hypothetical protein
LPDWTASSTFCRIPHVRSPSALSCFGALLKSGYFFPMLKGTELLAGAAFLSKRLVPLAVAVIAPVVVNILAFHVFLAPEGVPLALVLLVLEVYLAWTCRRVYRPILEVPDADPRQL